MECDKNSSRIVESRIVKRILNIFTSAYQGLGIHEIKNKRTA